MELDIETYLYANGNGKESWARKAAAELTALKQREAALVAGVLEVMFKDGWCQECGLGHTIGFMRVKLSEMNLPTPEWFDNRIMCFHDYGE